MKEYNNIGFIVEFMCFCEKGVWIDKENNIVREYNDMTYFWK